MTSTGRTKLNKHLPAPIRTKISGKNRTGKILKQGQIAKFFASQVADLRNGYNYSANSSKVGAPNAKKCIVAVDVTGSRRL
jgi:hypothetical protein